jgi:hypothetical protein
MASQSSVFQGASACPPQSNTNMTSISEKTATGNDVQATEKRADVASTGSLKDESMNGRAQILGATPEEIIEAEEHARTMDLNETKRVRRLDIDRQRLLIPTQRAENLIYLHEHDPNFSSESIIRIQAFLNNEDIFTNPHKHEDAISDIKTEIALVTINSPYAEVRAVVSNKDDPSTPAGTIRAWTIGLFFVVLQSFVNQLFSVRQPTIRLQAPVIQLLSFPLGKAWEKWLPVGEFTLFGEKLQLNPGNFNQKEHMLISIMANVSTSLPHSRYIIFTSWLKKYFDLPFAADFGFQICLSVSKTAK